MVGRIIGVLITGGVGAAIAVLGWFLWQKGLISLFHDYHVDNLSEKNKTAFCKRSGIGLFIIGSGLLITAIIFCLTNSAYSFLCFVGCFVIGFALLISAGIKYNR